MANTARGNVTGGIALALSLCAITLLRPVVAAGESISEVESRADRLHSDAQSLYRLDDDDMNMIWEAYCGRFDPKIKEDREFAADIGQQLQNKERGILEQLLGGDLPSLVESATKLLGDSDARDRAQSILESLNKEEQNLRKLYDGVVLKGSNHPFVQYAIEYGKKQHEDMCDRFGESPKICDQRFPGMDGRPDLVAMESGHLVVFEFKPDNSKAKSLGWDQVGGYLPAVQSYYQSFFEDGRNAGFKGEPDSDHGGRAILEKLKDSKDAWSSDGKVLQVVPHVETYSMCEKRFN